MNSLANRQVLFLIIFASRAITNGVSMNLEIHVVLWENKPYAYNVNETLLGIYPDVFQRHKCTNIVFHIKKPLLKQADAFRLFLSNDPWKELGEWYNISKNDTVMFGPHGKLLKDEETEGFNQKHIGSSKSIVMVVNRDRISLYRNLFNAIEQSRVLIYFMVAITFASGILIWFIECWGNNKQFSSSFLCGVASGMWWSTITMSTVGYGDKVPKSLLGRIVTIAWIWMSVILVSCMTSILTNSWTQPIEFSKIVVLNNSLEQHSLETTHHRDLEVEIEDTYENVLKKVEKDEDFVALVEDTKMSQILKDNNIKKVDYLPYSEHEGSLDWVFQLSENTANLNNTEACMKKIGGHAIKKSFANYASTIRYKKIDDTEEPLNSLLTISILSAVGGLLLLGSFYDLVLYCHKRKKRQTADINLNQSNTLKLELTQVHLKKRIVSMKEEINESLTELQNMLEETMKRN